MRFTGLSLTLVASLLAAPLAAADFDHAVAAKEAGDRDAAFAEFLELAHEGHPLAQLELAYIYWDRYESDDGPEENLGEYFYWLGMAARQGVAEAHVQIGFEYALGDYLPGDFSTSYAWFEIAYINGDDDALDDRAIWIPYISQEMIDEGIALADRCLNSNYTDCNWSPFLLPAAELDRGLAAYEQGYYDLAFAEFSSLAEDGDTEAQYMLGRMYVDGQGVAKDAAEGAAWLSRAAIFANHAEAQFLLAHMYDTGDYGVEQDIAGAVHWYETAAKQGHAGAQAQLAAHYIEGNGVPEDPARAAALFHAAAKQGHRDAQTYLGAMHFSGYGVMQDRVLSHMWFSVAIEAGAEGLTEHLDRVAAQLTPEQLADARTRADICIASDYQDCG